MYTNNVKNRLIACLLWNNGILIQSKGFKHTNAVCNLSIAIEFFNSWAIDEIILLNVSPSISSKNLFINELKKISKNCFIPLAVGGWITSSIDARNLITNGADKVVINTQAYINKNLICEIKKDLGSQCIVCSIDYKKHNNENYVYINRGKTKTTINPIDWSIEVESLGAGEIFLTSINNDGSKKGYDLPVLKEITTATKIPIIASGGVGKFEHFKEGITIGNAHAVSAANIFHYVEQCSKKAKNFLFASHINVRKPEFYNFYKKRNHEST